MTITVPAIFGLFYSSELLAHHVNIIRKLHIPLSVLHKGKTEIFAVKISVVAEVEKT
jgi:hypothetical protein